MLGAVAGAGLVQPSRTSKRAIAWQIAARAVRGVVHQLQIRISICKRCGINLGDTRTLHDPGLLCRIVTRATSRVAWDYLKSSLLCKLMVMIEVLIVKREADKQDTVLKSTKSRQKKIKPLK